jgi:hypothetical protein
MADLGRERFVFLVQEFEPAFTPFGSIHAIFRQAYEFPQFDLFSTELLRDFFRDQSIGIYEHGDDDGKAIIFENAITSFDVSRATMARSQKRLLFYARPEAHAARNMFEMGLLALVELVGDKRFDATRWSFHGIGSIDRLVKLDLGTGVPLLLMPRVSFQQYVELLPSFDVGLSLMLSPHPSLVPLDMAAAGMWCVTNTFATKTAERLCQISTNLVAAEPTVEGVMEALLIATSQVDDLDARLAGAKLNWVTDWSTAFSPAFMDRLESFLS